MTWFYRARWAQILEVATSRVPKVNGFDECGIGVPNFAVCLAVFECGVEFSWRCGTRAVAEGKAGHVAYGAVDQHFFWITKWVNATTRHGDFGGVVGCAAVVIDTEGENVTAVVNHAGNRTVGCPAARGVVVGANGFGFGA